MKTKHYVVVATFGSSMYKGTYTKTGLRKYLKGIFETYNLTDENRRKIDLIGERSFISIDLSETGNWNRDYMEIHEVRINVIEYQK